MNPEALPWDFLTKGKKKDNAKSTWGNDAGHYNNRVSSPWCWIQGFAQNLSGLKPYTSLFPQNIVSWIQAKLISMLLGGSELHHCRSSSGEMEGDTWYRTSPWVSSDAHLLLSENQVSLHYQGSSLRTWNLLLRTSTLWSSSMYSQTRLYRDCMLSGALQKYSGVSKTVLRRFTEALWRKTLPMSLAISFLLMATFPTNTEKCQTLRSVQKRHRLQSWRTALSNAIQQMMWITSKSCNMAAWIKILLCTGDLLFATQWHMIWVATFCEAVTLTWCSGCSVFHFLGYTLCKSNFKTRLYKIYAQHTKTGNGVCCFICLQGRLVNLSLWLEWPEVARASGRSFVVCTISRTLSSNTHSFVLCERAWDMESLTR